MDTNNNDQAQPNDTQLPGRVEQATGQIGDIVLKPNIIRGPGGKFLPGSGGGITRDNAKQLLQARRDKTAALLRNQIASRAEKSGRLSLPINAGPSAVLAAAGGLLFDEIVLNSDAVARYRLDAWREIGVAAELLGDRREKQAENGINVSIGVDLAREIVQKLMQNRQIDE